MEEKLIAIGKEKVREKNHVDVTLFSPFVTYFLSSAHEMNILPLLN